MFLALSQVPHEVKVSVLNRVAAKVIDLIAVFFVAVILPYPAGPLVGFLYSIGADGFGGRSLGKRLLKLKVVKKNSKAPLSLKDSLLRNAPVGVATFFGIIPVWGWVILGLLGLPLLVMEVYLMLTVANGQRLGDVMGDTQVVDNK